MRRVCRKMPSRPMSSGHISLNPSSKRREVYQKRRALGARPCNRRQRRSSPHLSRPAALSSITAPTSLREPPHLYKRGGSATSENGPILETCAPILLFSENGQADSPRLSTRPTDRRVCNPIMKDFVRMKTLQYMRQFSEDNVPVKIVRKVSAKCTE